ncbi:flagellar hook-associated protein FlgK [Acidisphaera sp. L21]|uniref:flagellar hook-associated protein FlgK n=1 Tax=Acidisphaera sp. L21 TaxID=1641851 RepID=UPI00131BCFF9|nr:flagellar basal body rod C-terminal domain-containing protein [Acidisphaera sp. L21]
MSLDLGLTPASTGLASINRQMAVVSQNVANAGTAGYSRELVANTSLTAGGVGYGVQVGVATRETDAALQKALNQQNAAVAGQQVTSDTLASVDAAQGATAAGNDLASRLGTLTDAFTTLATNPSNQAQQSAVVSAASNLASGIRSQSAAYTAARQSVQDGLVTDVSSLNAAVSNIGKLSDEIIAGKSRGESTADLEAQRDAQEQTAAQIGGLRFIPSGNGDVTAVSGGLIVDTRAQSGPFKIDSTTLNPGSSAPQLTLSGTNVTSAIKDGSLGARLTLRDTTLPQAQAGLDEFAQTLSTRLANQGLSLFTDPSGNLPATGGTPVQAGYIGYSASITVNPSVSATPSLVRDGTNSVADGTGSATAFTPNPAGGPAGSTTLINRVLLYGFGAQAQSGVNQPPVTTTGLGADGSFSLPYNSGGTLASFAANLVGSQAQTAGAAKDALTDSSALQNTLSTKLQDETGVSIDTELSNMVVLQNAYGANAKIITASQSMWTTLLNAVTP